MEIIVLLSIIFNMLNSELISMGEMGRVYYNLHTWELKNQLNYNSNILNINTKDLEYKY